jgi:hypothetical protein
MMGEYILYSIEKSFDESMITVCYWSLPIR